MSRYITLLFYKYVRLEDAESFALRHLKFSKELGIKGRVLIGEEGINGSVSGSEELCQAYKEHLWADPRLSDIWFKEEVVIKPSFQKMHVRYRKEIVTLSDTASYIDPNTITGTYLEPEAFAAMKDEEDVIVVDMRNDFEHRVGKFKNALTLPMKHFRDLPSLLPHLEPYKDKKIIAYCTGGIRCEKATGYLMTKGFKEVFQLHGGILNYYQKTGGKDFEGKMYVFDNRLHTNVNDINPTIISRCFVCGTPSERMINCSNPECNVHVAVCEECGWKLEGACSDQCQTHPERRPYDGTGYYTKPEDPLAVKREIKVLAKKGF